MKATGIVRRIDDLGRVVIPKEIRRTMRIREGDPLEIYTSNDGEVIFKKYSPINELAEGAVQAAEVISKLGGAPAVVFDRDHVVAVSGVQKKEYSERRISPALEDLLENRKSFVYTSESTQTLSPIEGIDKTALAVFPIISSGDITGAVAFMSNGDNKKATEQHKMLAQAAAMFLGKQIEE
ncbi:MAG: stage V sporulation T C-terminal domain-containing protein [Oscillospiraceae bacterium]